MSPQNQTNAQHVSHPSMSTSTIYILYNAKASVLGKLDYARRKLSAAEDSTPCAACDLTHGGLRLSESAVWKEAKRRINAHIEQLHQDELTAPVSSRCTQ